MHLYRLGELNLVFLNRYFPYPCSDSRYNCLCLFMHNLVTVLNTMLLCLSSNISVDS